MESEEPKLPAVRSIAWLDDWRAIRFCADDETETCCGEPGDRSEDRRWRRSGEDRALVSAQDGRPL